MRIFTDIRGTAGSDNVEIGVHVDLNECNDTD